ncbi:MAG: GTPase HflX [Firmicutes bacterium]|nr:GTPase HflX [Bacillota bacterium]
MGGNDLKERAILIGIDGFLYNDVDFKFLWSEFDELVKAAGAEPVARVVQIRANPDPALFLGSGKAEELKMLVRETRADLIISLQDLSPVQVRNLEDLTGVRILDRTGLILDIFAQRAKTKEGKIQVELAQLNYLLPRLSGGLGKELSRLGGGIGTRGPGETKLEVDRRRIRRRIADLRRGIKAIELHRSVQRRRRQKFGIPTVSLVGYTNAGKSTLFNRLTNAGVSAARRLFDTLDPVSRRILIAEHQEIILMDTVGFIRDLPHQLVAAFKATLEETARATLLIQVLDGANPEIMEQYLAVREVLKELDLLDAEIITVLNKADLIEPGPVLDRICKEWDAIPISALTSAGIDDLLNELRNRLTKNVRSCRLMIPFTDAGLLDILHRKARVLEEDFTETGIKLLVEMEQPLLNQFQKFLVK